MYHIDVLLSIPTELGDVFTMRDEFVVPLEIATDRYVDRKKFVLQSSMRVVGKFFLRFSQIKTPRDPISIKRSLVKQFDILFPNRIGISVAGIKVKWWEQYTKQITMILGLTSLVGLMVGLAAWRWPLLLSEYFTPLTS